jgi:hypothetical protein
MAISLFYRETFEASQNIHQTESFKMTDRAAIVYCLLIH